MQYHGGRRLLCYKPDVFRGKKMQETYYTIMKIRMKGNSSDRIVEQCMSAIKDSGAEQNSIP